MMPQSSAAADPYLALGVARDASLHAIKQAYRRVALETHPDRNAGDPEAAGRFRRASQAYALLRDPDRRSAFDRTGRWDDGRWAPADLDVQLAEAMRIFTREFRAGMDLPSAEDWVPAHDGTPTVAVDITYPEVELGGRRRLRAPCTRCGGSGAREGSSQVRCTSCGGSGRLRQVETSFLGPRIYTEPCESCRASGRRPLLVCTGCDGSGRSPGDEMLDLVIPRGVGDGDPLPSLSPSGARFVARLVEDQRWARDGADLYVTARIPYEVAVLGGETGVELPGREHRAAVAPGTPSGHRVRVPGQGLPSRDGDGRGDLILTLHVAVPDRPGPLDRWLLTLRRGRRDAGAGAPAWICRTQARAGSVARGAWAEWRARHLRSSLLRIEKAAASLRSAAGLVSTSEQRLGPLLEQAFPLIAPEAARARQRLHSGAARPRNGAIATLTVDLLVAAALTAGLWLGARYAVPAVLAAGETPWWLVMAGLHPAAFAGIPLLAGLTAGALRIPMAGRWIRIVVAVPLGLALAGASAATGAAWYAIAVGMVSGAESMVSAMLSATLAITLGMTPVILFLLSVSVVNSTRTAVGAALDGRDRRLLRTYDEDAARLATFLEGTERAFRQLLSRAEDAHRPLTSLLDGAAGVLDGERDRMSRPGGGRAALALAGAVIVTTLWAAATALAISAAFVLAGGGLWLGIATAAAVAGLCALGSVFPARLLEHHRVPGLTTGLATALAVAALAGVFATGGVDPNGPVWLLAAGAAAALALSFRLPETGRATWLALTLLVSGIVALVLWPPAVAVSAWRGRSGRAA
jgi:molecular chaperone DnaJ